MVGKPLAPSDDDGHRLRLFWDDQHHQRHQTIIDMWMASVDFSVYASA